MSQIFNSDNFFWKCFDKMADVLGLSLLWFLCSLPVVTIPAASTALYDCAARCVRGGEPSVYGRFFRTFKREFKLATPAGLLWGAAALLPMAGARIFAGASQGSQLLAVLAVTYYILTAIPAGMLCWLFPLCSRYRLTFRELNRTAVQLWLVHLPSTLAMAALLALCVDLTVQLLLPVCCLPCLLALAHSLFAERAFQKHLPEGGREEDDPS